MDLQFSYLGQENDSDSDNTERQEENIRKGRRYRGKDLAWRPKTTFENQDDYKASSLYVDLKENYTLRNQERSNAKSYFTTRWHQ